MTTTLSRRDEVALSVAGLCLIGASYGLARFAYGLFVPSFRESFALGPTTTGVIAAGGYVVYCVAIVATSALTPRWGGRVVAAAAGACATVGTLTVALAPNSAVLVVGVLLGGASTGLVSPALAHAVARSVDPCRQGRAQTVINAGTGVGVAIAGPVALLTHEHWRGAWLVFAALSAAATIGAVLVIPAGGTDGERVSVLPRPLLPPGSLRLTAAAVLAGAGSAAVWTFGRDLMTTDGDLGEQASTVAWILLGLFGVAGAVAGDLASRIGLAAAWTTSTGLLAVASATLALAPGSLLLASASSAVFGAAYIAMSGLLLLWGTRVHQRSPAAGVGWAFLMLALGQAAGAAGLGVLAEVGSARWSFAIAAGIAVAGALVRPRPAPSGVG